MSQHLDALAHGNRIRLAAAAFRRKIAAMDHPQGALALATQLRAEEIPAGVASMTVERYLRCAHRIGHAAAMRLLRRADVHRRYVRVRDLTERERHSLARRLENPKDRPLRKVCAECGWPVTWRDGRWAHVANEYLGCLPYKHEVVR